MAEGGQTRVLTDHVLEDLMIDRIAISKAGGYGVQCQFAIKRGKEELSTKQNLLAVLA